MAITRKQSVVLFVDRFSQSWVVRDAEGNFWIVLSVEDPWGHRNRSTRPKSRPLNRFSVIIYICLVFRFGQICADSRNA